MALTDYSYSRRNKGVENVVRSIGLDENWVHVAKKYSTQPAIKCPKLTIETTRTRFETCVKLTIKTLPERDVISVVLVVSHLVLLFLLLTLSW